MERHVSWDLQYLALPTAVSELHMQLFRLPPDVAPLVMQSTLNELAKSLASLAPICVVDSLTGEAKEIPRDELAAGMFTRGAHAFVTKTGKEYRNLRIQRRQLKPVAAILGKSSLERALEVVGSKARLAVALELDVQALDAFLVSASPLPPKVLGAALDLIAATKRDAQCSLDVFLQRLTNHS